MTVAVTYETTDAAIAEPASPPTDTPVLSEAEQATAEAVGLAKSVAFGSLIGVVLSFFSVLLAMGVAGYGWGPGAGLAAFTAFWGGLGFGSMVGGVTYLSSLEDH